MGSDRENDATVESYTHMDGVNDLHPCEPCPECAWDGGTWFRWLVSGKGVKIICGKIMCQYETPWFADRQLAIDYWNVTSKLSR